MTESLSYLPAAQCQVGYECDRPVCFQARLEATAGGRRVHRHADLCADHLGDTVQALAAWARAQGLDGKVTVLAIDRPVPGLASPYGPHALPGDRLTCGFAFGTILLNP